MYLFDDRLVPLPQLATSNSVTKACKFGTFTTERRIDTQAHEEPQHIQNKESIIPDDVPYDLEQDFPMNEDNKNIGIVPLHWVRTNVREKEGKVMLCCRWCDFLTETKDHLKAHEKSLHGEVKVDFIEYDDDLYDLEKEESLYIRNAPPDNGFHHLKDDK